MRGEFNPGAGTPKHTHPGEEVGYILEGTVVMELEGKPPVTLKAGDVFFIPAGQVHAAKNAGTTPAKVLSTYIVEKGKPLATPVPAANQRGSVSRQSCGAVSSKTRWCSARGFAVR